jgi:hypothetical protein
LKPCPLCHIFVETHNPDKIVINGVTHHFSCWKKHLKEKYAQRQLELPFLETEATQ